MTDGSVRVPLTAYGGAAGATLVWAQRGKLWLTSVLKARVALGHDAVGELTPGVELHYADAPTAGASLRHVSDLAPPTGSCELILAGHACALGEQPVSSMAVRLYFGTDDRPLVDKTLHVYGERSGGAALPQPFTRMPLVYERAVGGPGSDNPVGRRLGDPARPPNIVDPRDPQRVAGFGPIAASWPGRARLAARAPTLRGALLELPDELPLAYFHAAPSDQRFAAPGGDEWLIVDGMRPDLPRLQTQLPLLRARARVTGGRELPERESVELTLARIAVDMDRCVADLTFSASVAVGAEELPSLQVLARLEALEDAESMELSSETMNLDEAQLASVLGEALPWSQAGPHTPPAATLPALSALPFGKAQGARAPRPPTVDLIAENTVTSLEELQRAAMPFSHGSAAPPAAIAVPSFHDEDSADSATSVAPVPVGVGASALPFGAPASPPAFVPSAGGPPAFVPSAGGPPAFVPSAGGPPAFVPSPGGPPAVAPPAAVPPAAVPPAAAQRVADEPSSPTAPLLTLGAAGAAGRAEKPVAGRSEPPPDGTTPPPSAVAPASMRPSPASVRPPSADSAPPAGAEESGVRKVVLDNVRAGTAMHGMDLASADLSGLDLSGAVLSDAKLAGAKLHGTLLKGARLNGAKLVGADLRGCDLSGASLARADLTRAILDDAIATDADLSDVTASQLHAMNAKLSNVRAERAKLVQAHLDGAVLEGASLRDADLSGSHLDGTSFKAATLTSARMSEARGEGAIFSGARLDGATFTGATLRDASFEGADAPRTTWERSLLDRSVFDGANLREANFARCSLEVASLRGVDLQKSDLSNISAEGADFSESKLAGCDLRMSKLPDARLEQAILSDVNAQKLIANGARMEGADLQRASLRGARLKGSDLGNTKLAGADLRDADLEGARLDGADTAKAKLAGANLKGARGT